MNAPVEIVETLNLVYLATKQVTTHLYNISHIALLENDLMVLRPLLSGASASTMVEKIQASIDCFYTFRS